MGGNWSKGMPGGLTRLGPAKVTGLARSDQIGSVRMLSPPVWIKSVAWPTMVTRKASGAKRSAGAAGLKALG